MVHIDEVGNRYAWKGPAWSDSSGHTNGRLTQRPTLQLQFMNLIQEEDLVLINSIQYGTEAYDIRFGAGSHWGYSKDVNGKLAPKFWVYHRDWYWYGNYHLIRVIPDQI